MAYKTYNGMRLFSYDDSLDQPKKTTTQTQKKNPNAFESFFNWIGDTAGAIGNTLKDTVGAAASFGATNIENKTREATEKSNQAKLDNIAKKYGFNKFNDIDEAAYKNNPEMVKELQQATKENSEKIDEQTKAYKDNWAVKNTANVKQGDYGANAIKTWNTLADVLTAPASLPASMAINAGQGYLSAIGDEMQGKSDLSNMNWGNVAKQGTANALAGVAGGIAGAGAGNLGSKLAGSSNMLGKAAGKGLNNSLVRGAVSGAAGGATGAGLGTAFEGGDLGQVLANAAAGAQQGAGQGAVMSGAMSLGNRAINGIKNKVAGAEMPTVVEAPDDTRTRAVLENDQGTDIPELEKARGWSGEELSIKKKNILNKAGDTLEQTGEAIRNRDINNRLYSKTAEGVYERDSINRLRKLGYEPESYSEAAKVSETTNKFIDDILPKDLKVKNTTIQADLTNYDDIPGTINNSKFENDITKQIIKRLDNSRTGNANTMDEYDVKSLWKSSKELMDLSTAYRKKGMNVNGDVTNSDYVAAADRLNAAARNMRAIADGEVQWGDSFDKQILTNRLKNLGATDNDIKYLSQAENLADLKRRTSVYEDARQMYKEIGKSNIRRNAVSGTSTNPINIATQESGVGEVIRAATRPLGKATGAITRKAGQALNKAGNWLDNGSDVVNKVNQVTSNPGQTTELPYALIGRLSGTEEGRLAAENPSTYAQPENLEAQLGNTVMTNDGGYTGLQNTTDSQGVTTTYGNSGNYGYSGSGNVLDRVVMGMENALNAGDVAAFSQLADIYNTLSKVYGTTSSSSSNSQQKLSATQQRANAAMNSLNRLEGMNPDLGYNLSGIPIVGDLATLGGNAYEGEAKSLAQQIGYMVSGSNIKQEEAEAIGKAYVPQPFDSDATRRLKLQRAREIISQYQNGYAENPTETYAY